MTLSSQSPAPSNGPLQGLYPAQRLLALATGLAVTFALSQFPMDRAAIGAGLLLYAAALYRYPWVWMLVIPALLPVVDLAIWSGRFFFNEFDFTLMTTLAVLYWRRADGRILPGLVTRPYLPVTLLALSYALGITISLYPLPALDMNSFATYISPYNALRVARGFFWAWLLMPFLLREFKEDPAKAKLRLLAGVTVGLALAGICVLWERGVFVDLFWGRNIYALLQGLLDFTGTYRVTGMFSGMNVGDTAIDGYLSLAVPLSLYWVIYGKSHWVRLAGLSVFTLGGYSVIVTFSRGLYGAFGLALLIITTAHILSARRSLMNNIWEAAFLFTGFILATALLFFLYITGGYEALSLGTIAVVGGAFTASRLPIRKLQILFILWIAGAVAVGALIFRAIEHHKWSTTGPSLALGLAVASALILYTLPILAARKRARGLNLSTAIIASLLLTVFWMGIVPPLSGVRVLTRFSTTSRDMNTRENHWRTSLDAMKDSWQHRLYGMGVGSYPRDYLSSQIGKLPVATYSYDGKPGATYMSLGAGDFNMIQRVHLKPHTEYNLKLAIRTGAEIGGVTVKLCHKHILYSERYVPDCRIVNVKGKTGNKWLTQSIKLNSGSLGRYGIFYWPTTLMLHNSTSRVINVTDISLTGPDGHDLVHNGNFAANGDFWFLISDFEHLAWHAKNLYLHLYFEQGLAGLIVFLVVVIVALRRLWINHRSGDHSAIFWLAAIFAFLAVGLFGTSIDMPRVTVLFYLILFAALSPPGKIKPGKVSLSQ